MNYQFIRDFYNIYVFGWFLHSVLKDCNSILEIGCGYDSLIVKAGIAKRADVTAVDVYQPYIDRHRELGNYRRCICCDITMVNFKQVFDAVVCMDVLEHIKKAEALDNDLLVKMKHWGKRVIITTPNGYTTNYHNSDGNPYQEHLSSWYKEDFLKYGYRVFGLSGWKGLRGVDGNVKRQPFLFWGTLSVLTEPLVYHHPEKAFHLMAVYEDSDKCQSLL